jgi:glycosyltransferase involved in cell wall biosynthesis
MKTIRVVSFIEASTVTGPAGNLIRFARCAREQHPDLPQIELSFATFSRTESSNRFIDAVRLAGIEIDIVHERSPLDPTSLRGIAGILRRRQPDIIQTHAVKSHFLMKLSGLRRKYPWLAFHHGYTAEDLKMRLYNRLDRVSLPAAGEVVTVCTPFAKDLADAGLDPGRISVLPNSIDPVHPATAIEIEDLRRRLGLPPSEKVILSIGRFSSEKAQADLVPAALSLRRRCPDLPFRVVLVGDGPERERVREAVTAAAMDERFLFAGYQTDVRAFYGMADLFVLPSHSEGCPNVLLEAMAFGVPIAATSVGGVPETVDHNATALLTGPADPEALAGALHRILREPGLASALAAAGRESVRKRFSPHAYRARLTSTYRRLMAR